MSTPAGQPRARPARASSERLAAPLGRAVAGARSLARALGFTGPGAARNRALSVTTVAVYVAGAVMWVPDPTRRAALHTAVVLGLGYGHLVGALVGLAGRTPVPRVEAAASGSPGRRRIAGWLRRAALGLGVAGAFAAFTRYGAGSAPLVLVLLAVSTWHTVENDWALEDTYARGGRPAAPGSGLDDHLVVLGATSLVLAAAAAAGSSDLLGPPRIAATPEAGRAIDVLRGAAVVFGSVLCLRERTPRTGSAGLALVGAGALLPVPLPLAFADVFALTTGYHLVSWLVLSWDRQGLARRELARALIATHAAPVVLAIVCTTADGIPAARLRDAFFAPAPYLFWSVTHVGQTLLRRLRRVDRAGGGRQSDSGAGSEAAVASTD